MELSRSCYRSASRTSYLLLFGGTAALSLTSSLSEPTSVWLKDTVLVTCPVPGWPGHVEEDKLGL